MPRRVAHWIGWTLGFDLLPLLGVAVVAYVTPAPGRSVRDLLATGDCALLAVAWFAAGISELRDAPPERAAWRSLVLFVSCLSIAVNAYAFGAVYADRTGGESAPRGFLTPHAMVVASVIDLAFAGSVSSLAVLVGTPKEVKDSVG